MSYEVDHKVKPEKFRTSTGFEVLLNCNERYRTVSAKSSEFVYSFVICLLSKVLHARTAKMITQQLLAQLF